MDNSEQQNFNAGYVRAEQAQVIPPPIDRAVDAIDRMIAHPEYRPDWLKMIIEARSALNKVDDNRAGLVVGSGDNSTMWKQRGWRTLDIDRNSGADIVADANKMDTVIMPGSLDYIYSENIRFDPQAKKGVGWGKILEQSNRALKKGGILVVCTAHKENKPTATVPDRKKFSKWMARNGFDTVTEVHRIITTPNPNGGPDIKQQRVVYYGRKLAEGFDASRA